MNTPLIKDTSIKTAKEELAHSVSIGNDLLLTDDLGKLPMPTSPKRMTFILLALCTRGSASYTVDTQRLTAKQGDIIIVSERHVVDGYTASPDLQGMGFMLSVDFFYEIIRNVSEVSSLLLFSKDHPIASLSESEAELFKDYFYLIMGKVSNTDNRFRRDVARALMLAMFYDLSNFMSRMQPEPSSKQTRANAIFTEFIQLLEDNYKRERRVGWYAEQLCISPKYLSETVKSVSKRTPNEWIYNYVTLEIRISLKNTSKTIKEIAQELNFPSQSFLGKFFKEHVGMSPLAYRKS